MEVSAGDVKVYTVNGTPNRVVPKWVKEQQRQQQQRDHKPSSEQSSRVDLIQDFEFPDASLRVRTTRDGKYIVATGIYKPYIRFYELDQTALKFEQGTESENVQFEMLSDDWTKSVHLQSDRSVQLNSLGMTHYSVRVPKAGRDLAYYFPSCDAYIAASSDEVYRLNLEQGRFLKPLEMQSVVDGVNCVKVNPAHQLIGCATDGGCVEMFDPRSRGCVGMLHTGKNALTALAFADDGLTMAVGTIAGENILYDLRSPLPLTTRDHGYGLGIKRIHFLPQNRILFADSKIIKIWDREGSTKRPFVSIEPPSKINDVEISSGMVFVANEGSPIQTYFVPRLGPAPRWCSFLDNLTEELAESQTKATMYDNYKFVTRTELDTLGLGHIIGTEAVRGYMHGYFIDQKLFEEARLIANPFEYEEYRRRKVQEKLERQRETRIRSMGGGTGNKAKVNKKLAEKLGGAKTKLAGDNRFQQVFDDTDFLINDAAKEAVTIKKATRRQQRTAAEESDEERANNQDRIASDEEQWQKKKFVHADRRKNIKGKPSERKVIAGEKEVKFKADSSSNAIPKVNGARDQGRTSRRFEGRRSASGNTFRRMGIK